MEKDIEILERITVTSFNTNNIYDDVEKVNTAIENLINRVKELEEKQKKLKQEKLELIKEKNVVHFSDVQEELTSMRNALDIKQAEMNMQNEIITTCYIPKSKIKEKIEEVKNSKENYTFEKLTSEDIRKTIITNLEELLNK